jgi:hypothetical protein
MPPSRAALPRAGRWVTCTASLLAGCASTQVALTGPGLAEPLCRIDRPALPTQVMWGTRWRVDQKEPGHREDAALRGIQAFVEHTPCLAPVGLQRLQDAAVADEELAARARANLPAAQRVVFIVVHELGPRLLVGSPRVIEGGTEVVLHVRVLDLPAARVLADTVVTWRRGGAFVIRGVGTLDQDMTAALTAVLMPGAAPR